MSSRGMRTIIAGSRTVTDYSLVKTAISDCGFEVSAIISGCARGADKLGERYANEHNLPIIRFPADWDGFGKRAGYLRNAIMAANADALIAIWDGKSKGTKDMIDKAKRAGLAVIIKHITPETQQDGERL